MRISEVFAMGAGSDNGASVPGYNCNRDDCTYGFYPYFNGYDYSRDYGRTPYYYDGYNYGGYTYRGHYRLLGIL
ncbi:MAG: hypothetical protein JO287_09810 [Pseudonocardiales bacterium]|nr:hypothetical protein [Pseudonocardiales bacterium]